MWCLWCMVLEIVGVMFGCVVLVIVGGRVVFVVDRVGDFEWSCGVCGACCW